MKRALYRGLLRGFALSPVPWTLRRFARRRGVRSVLYHHVGEESAFTRGIGVATPPEVFDAHIRRLSLDYEIVSLADVLGGRVPKRALLVTFDDVYRSVLDNAAPILKARGIKPVFSIATSPVFEGDILMDNLLSYAEEENPDALAAAFGVALGTPASAVISRVLPALSPAERTRRRDALAEKIGGSPSELGAQTGLYLKPSDLKALADAGFDFGCHTKTHIHAGALSADEMEDEIIQPARQIEDAAGKPVRVFSFPFGSARDCTPGFLDFMDSSPPPHDIRRYLYTYGPINRDPDSRHIFRSSVGRMRANELAAELEAVSLLRTAYANLKGGGTP